MSNTGGSGSLFPTAPARLAGPFGTKIADKDGNRRDTNVQPLAEELLSVLMNAGVLNYSKPLEINYTGTGAALKINTSGPDALGIEINARYNGNVETVRLGIAEHSSGIIASDVLPADTPLDPFQGRSINTSADVMWELLRLFFGRACVSDGEPSLGQDGMEQLAEQGHAAIPDHDRTKAQVLYHPANSDCLKWVDLDDLMCAMIQSMTGYDNTKTQVVGHVSGTCQLFDVGACA